MDKMADFHDRISPMLVKELRQGLRAKTFVSAFIGLHGLITFMMLMAVASDTSNPGSLISGIIIGFYSFIALLIQPLRNVGCLHTEIKQNTLEALQLTRLGAWGIVMGKWCSSVSQTLLTVISIIPYLILRYFLGGMEMANELMIIFTITMVSIFITSIIIGVSASPLVLIRRLLPLGWIFSLLFFSTGLLSTSRSLTRMFSGASPSDSLIGIGIFMLLGCYLSYFALSLAASAVGTMAENYSRGRRIITSVTLLICGGITWYQKSLVEPAVIGLILITIVTPFLALTLSEPLQLLPLHCRKAMSKGIPGKWFHRLFYPGWVSGTPWVLAVILLANGIFFLTDHSRSENYTLFSYAMNSIFGTLLLAHIVNCMLPLKKTAFGYRYYVILFIIQLITSILQIGITINFNQRDADILTALPLGWVLGATPASISLPGGSSEEIHLHHLKLGLYGLICIGLALKALKQVKQVEEQAAPAPDTNA
jgi:hypothetical protein